MWDFLSELHSSLCERRLERTGLRPALLPVKTAKFTQFFHQVWRHTVKSLSLTESVYGALHCCSPKMTCCYNIYLHFSNTKDEKKEVKENGDKMKKCYRWEGNTKGTWKRTEVRNAIQQMKRVFIQFLADITLFIYTVKGKGHPSTGHEGRVAAEV